MTKAHNKEKMKVDLQAERDVRRFIVALQDKFFAMKDAGDISNKILSELAGLDQSYVSRILNGKNDNPNIKTLAKIFRAMNARLAPSVLDVSAIPVARDNYSKALEYDAAVWSSYIEREGVKFIDCDESVDKPATTHSRIRWDDTTKNTRSISRCDAAVFN